MDYYYADIYINKVRTKKALHHYIWEKHHNQKVPKGYCVHHKDEDKSNNDIENLELKTLRKHRQEHSRELFKDANYKKKILTGLKKAVKEAPKWHRSKQGREWHKEHGTEMWTPENRKKRTIKKQCIYCNKEFDAYFKNAKYCSRRCNFRHTRGVKKFYRVK